MMKITHFLMGTLVTIEAKGKGLEPVVDAALTEMARIERLMSRFLPTSDVARLNATYSQPVIVSPETFWVIEKALLFSQLSGGAFDITATSGNRADYRDVFLDAETCQVSLGKPGITIDLGGIAKGYAVDRAIEVLRRTGVQDALVNAGGEVRALGSKALDEAWSVGVQHPRAQNGLLCRLPLVDRAVSTSGDYYKYHFQGGRRCPHILDPRRGKPARSCLTATVVADQALVADALATTAFVLGPDEGMHLIESLPGVEGLLVGKDGSVRTSSDLPAVWDVDPMRTVKNSYTRGRHHSHLGMLVGGMALLGALTLGCQGAVEVQPLPAPAEPAPAVTEVRTFLDGIYQGKSVSGILVEVEVTVELGRIADIQILEYKEISSIHAGKPTTKEEESWLVSRETVLKTIPKRIIEKQSTAVDTVTGATMSSETIIAAVEDALTKATP